MEKLKDIKIKTMLLCAEDDPILGLKEAVPYSKVKENANLLLAVT